MQRALYAQLQQFPGQQKEILDFFRNTPGASASLRAPIFEVKVIDNLLSEIDVTDKKVTKEELLADDEDDAAEKPAKKKRSEEHTSELQSLMRISYAVFCLKKKKKTQPKTEV